MLKFDIVNGLGRAQGFTRYLEICTPSTGLTFGRIDSRQFAVCHRLGYRWPEQYSDGHELTFRTSSNASCAALNECGDLGRTRHAYDIVFVDGYHRYACSRADIQLAMQCVAPGGIIIVHDCNPPDRHIADEEPHIGEWCGSTHAAFIDMVFTSDIAGYCVVDCDYGCGIIFTAKDTLPPNLTLTRPNRKLIKDWTETCEAGSDRYDFFDRHRATLLNLVAPIAFAGACNIRRHHRALSASNLTALIPEAARRALGDLRNGIGRI